MIAVRCIPACLALASLAFCQAPSVIVDGGNGKTVILTAADLSKLPRYAVNTTEHGVALYLLAEAADGYRALFALPALDAGFTDRKIYRAAKRDEKFRLSESGRLTEPRARITRLLLNHHFRGFDDHGDIVSSLQMHLFGATPGDDAFDFILANLHNDVRHYIAQLYILDLATKLIACG